MNATRLSLPANTFKNIVALLLPMQACMNLLRIICNNCSARIEYANNRWRTPKLRITMEWFHVFPRNDSSLAICCMLAAFPYDISLRTHHIHPCHLVEWHLRDNLDIGFQTN